MSEISFPPSPTLRQINMAALDPAVTIIRLEPGDHQIKLIGKRTGYTGRTDVWGAAIDPATGVSPTKVRLWRDDSISNVLVRRVTFEPASLPGQNNGAACVDTHPASERLVFGYATSPCFFQLADDISGWSEADKLAATHTMVRLRGKNMGVVASKFKNVRVAVATSPTAVGCKITDNDIGFFTVDAVEIYGAGTEVDRNTIHDCIHFPAELLHADAIQATGFTGSPITGIKIRDNVIDCGAACDYMQGVSLFDGESEGVVITGNKAVVKAYHGYSLLGGVGHEISRNELSAHPTSEAGKIPWVGLLPMKNGALPSGCIVRDNVTPKLSLAAGSTAAGGVTGNRTADGTLFPES
jgi:hypothetical protein